MAKHEFGILPDAPLPHVRYDAYEPDKYSAVSADDALIEAVDAYLADLPCYWHTLDRPAHGLAYCGITLIPPESLPALLIVMKNFPVPDALSALLIQAEREKKWVIHFGI